MPTSAKVGLLLISALVAATPASARRAMIVREGPGLLQFNSSPSAARSWALQATDPRLLEYPSTDVLSSELGVDEGKVELFHYGLEHAPSKGTVLSGVVDGGGIRLKVSW